MKTTVTTRLGKLAGSEEHGILVFRGIPYARPPVGELRWRAPQPLAPWRGVLSATRFGRSAPQNAPMARFLTPLIGVADTGHDEDCLYLNVWTPAADGKRRPVMVWIHGGAFTIGSGASAIYAGGRVAKRGDVVVVNINYRLGALGFLNLRSLDDRQEANFGLRDQVAALEWVRDNIEVFGGDPDNVTVFGESAGGMSVGTLAGTPSAAGLFQRAIAQSGAASNVSSAPRAARIAEDLLRELGEPGFDLERLRRRSVADLLAAQLRLSAHSDVRLGQLPWQPSVDGEVLPQQPLAAVAAGAARRVELMVGTNSDEWRLFMLGDPKGRRLDDAGLRRRLARVFAEANGDGAQLAERAFEVYARAAGEGRRWTAAERWTVLQSDRIFHRPAHALAEAQTRAGGSARVYLFTWAPPLIGGWLGSFHGLEIPFVFGTVRDGWLRQLFAFQPAIHALSDTMQRAWVEFARRGDPEHEGLDGWSPYEPERRPTMLLGDECGACEVPFRERHDFWAELAARGL